MKGILIASLLFASSVVIAKPSSDKCAAEATQAVVDFSGKAIAEGVEVTVISLKKSASRLSRECLPDGAVCSNSTDCCSFSCNGRCQGTAVF